MYAMSNLLLFSLENPLDIAILHNDVVSLKLLKINLCNGGSKIMFKGPTH